MDADSGWDKAMEVFFERMQSTFGFSMPSRTQSGKTFTVGFSKNNHSFKNSPYFYDPSNEEFTHLTTFKGLFGIINSCSIRLYNLINSNDPNELFSLNGVPTLENSAQQVKEHIYTFSFCKPETITNPPMWIKYGQVALNFEIINNVDNWDYYRISEMHYGESDFGKKFSDILVEMSQKFPAWNFRPNVESTLSLLSFHKETIHKEEKEIRLMFIPHLLRDRDVAKFDFRVSNIATGITKYIEVPLYVGNEKKAMISQLDRHIMVKDSSRPLIKLKSIQFGDNETRVGKDKLNEIRGLLEDYLVAKFGYYIEIKQTLFETGLIQY